METSKHITQLNDQGYSIIPTVYHGKALGSLQQLVETLHSPTNEDLHAVRQLFVELPELLPYIYNQQLKEVLQARYPNAYFLSKAMYFNKPEQSNWFVGFHQDLTINVVERIDTTGFVNWTRKHKKIGVQPPLSYLQRTTTVRIHLDDTDETNGALRIIPKSHKDGIVRVDTLPEQKEEYTCCVQAGGIMLMSPLLVHASSRSTGNKRRVIHLEFCDMELPGELRWKERMEQGYSAV